MWHDLFPLATGWHHFWSSKTPNYTEKVLGTKNKAECYRCMWVYTINVRVCTIRSGGFSTANRGTLPEDR